MVVVVVFVLVPPGTAKISPLTLARISSCSSVPTPRPYVARYIFGPLVAEVLLARQSAVNSVNSQKVEAAEKKSAVSLDFFVFLLLGRLSFLNKPLTSEGLEKKASNKEESFLMYVCVI